ncbi:c-type cytochrome [Psychrobacter sp. I-STPA10]|uniref:c-type cytochrome n=1 Tax=Psychrobacter sp. I-STPA10 TaxID=2585769 RepID=UPI001E4B583E|nr:c-type cytochrome [Psychrobacter sp. I-STPA10]
MDCQKFCMHLTRITVAISSSMLLIVSAGVSGCERQPPDQRAPVTLPPLTTANIDNGKQLYHDLCDKCHKLTPGSNEKGPQLLRIYGAPAASLKDYKYSEVMINSGWVWDEKTLDTYLKDAQQALPGNRMRTDGVPDANERADIIAYLSTLRADAGSTVDQETTSTDLQQLDNPVDAPIMPPQ